MRTSFLNISAHVRRQRNAAFICSVVFLLSAIFCTSCDEGDTEPVILSRMFRPVNFLSSVDGITVKLSWTPIAGATYLLEISKDSLVFETDLHEIALPEKTSSYELEDLWGGTRYSARIKSVSSDPDMADSDYQSITFRTQSENIFQSVASSDIGTDEITVRWDNTKSVDHISVTATGVEPVTVVLTDDDLSAGQKTITGLTAGKAYQFRIYQGERLRGSVTATTANE